MSIIFYTFNLKFRDGILSLNASIYTMKFNQIIFWLAKLFTFWFYLALNYIWFSQKLFLTSFYKQDLNMYDETKLSEYKFRIAISIFLLSIITYAALFSELNGPAIFEIIFIGGAFSVLSLVHSCWAIRKITRKS